jgi:hypothetical protein
MDKDLKDIEDSKLAQIGKTRQDYEELVDDLEKSISEI